jgi:hypothetical protein
MNEPQIRIAEPRDKRTSELLKELLDTLPGGSVELGFLVQKLRTRSYGGLFIVLAALGLIPGISFFAGLAMIVPGLQLAIGFKAPVLPRLLRLRSLPTSTVQKIGYRILPRIKWLEQYVKPRWIRFTTPPVPNFIGLVFVALAFILMLPLPFSNLPPAIALLTLSLGMMERDGLLLFVGLTVAVIALLIGGFVVSLAWDVGKVLTG